MISLKGKNEIERKLDDLIERAQRIVDKDTKMVEYGMKTSQIRNLLEMISGTSSIKVVEVFIQYQMGRKETQKAWADSGFGKRLLENEIGYLMKEAKQISKNTNDDEKEVLIEMLRLYIGYLNRYFVYRQKGEGEER